MNNNIGSSVTDQHLNNEESRADESSRMMIDRSYPFEDEEAGFE